MLRQGVDAALSEIYKSSALPDLYKRWFASLGRPGTVLDVMFMLGQLPE
jgi:hypothetical protein